MAIDWRVFCFLLATCAVTGIAFGILPALAASRTDPQMALKQTSGNRTTGSRGRLRDALVVAEIALSFVLLASAGLLMRGFLRLQDTPTGFVADNVLTLRLTASLQDYRAPGSYGRYLRGVGEPRQTDARRTRRGIHSVPAAAELGLERILLHPRAARASQCGAARSRTSLRQPRLLRGASHSPTQGTPVYGS